MRSPRESVSSRRGTRWSLEGGGETCRKPRANIGSGRKDKGLWCPGGQRRKCFKEGGVRNCVKRWGFVLIN